MSAVISDDGVYRYRLDRELESHSLLAKDFRPLVFCMLNPSTADATLDDPTIRRCVGFAQRENAPRLTVVNVYAYRATDPKVMLLAHDPVGPENIHHILDAVKAGKRLVCAWGVNAGSIDVSNLVSLLKAEGVELLCLGTTKDGHPRHPLYVRADQPLIPWSPR